MTTPLRRVSVLSLLACVASASSGQASISGAATRCESFEKSDHAISAMELVSEGTLLLFDESRHADLAEALRPYWEALLRNDYALMATIAAGEDPSARDSLAELLAKAWEDTKVVDWRPFAVDIRVMKGRTTLAVFTLVDAIDRDGQCVEDVVYQELTHRGARWILSSEDAKRGNHLRPVK